MIRHFTIALMVAYRSFWSEFYVWAVSSLLMLGPRHSYTYAAATTAVAAEDAIHTVVSTSR